MKSHTANPDDFRNNPKKWAFDAGKGVDAFFEQNIVTCLADVLMEQYPDWRHRYLNEEHSSVHIDYVFKSICNHHPCQALPKIYHYRYVSRDSGMELGQLQEIATEAEAYLKRLEEYDKKYDVKSWEESEFQEKGLGDRFNTAKDAAKEAAGVCYYEMGNYFTKRDAADEGMAYYRKAAEINHEPEAVYKLLKHLTDTDQFAEAKQWCSGVKYAYLEWSDIRFRRIHSLVSFRLGLYDECIEELNEILEIEDDEAGRSLLEQVIRMRDEQKR